jgi:hypothetical protein
VRVRACGLCNHRYRPGRASRNPFAGSGVAHAPAAPDCELKTQPQSGQADPAAERTKLDYERQCYRHAELIVRGRLQRLQVAVGDTVKSVRLSEQRVAQ